jgi:CheY-like chemotaxis protein
MSLTRPGEKQRVLYIEDNPANGKLMAATVEKMGNAELIVVESAELGLEKAQEWLPHTILLDINLPGMSGKQALPLLREIPVLSSSRPRIYALTANAMLDEVNEAKKLGFDGYFTKPVDVHEIMRLLEE